MTTASKNRLRHVERIALAVAAVAAIATAVLGWTSPQGILPAWRLAGFACLQPAIGSLIFILIFRLTGGEWVEGLAPFLTAGTRLLPWIWMLILPLVWFPIAAKPHEREALRDERPSESHASVTGELTSANAALREAFSNDPERHFDPSLGLYFGRPLMVGRAAFYAVGFFLLAAGASRVMRVTSPAAMRWFGPVGLIGLVFMLHLLAEDWFALLEPGWYSTGFPLVWTAGQGIAGISAAELAAMGSGANPGSQGSSGRARGLDWGNLMLAAVMAWTYVAFVQWLIIWSGNLPAETIWYRVRSHDGWQWMVVGLAIFEFAVPFLILLSRNVKQRRTRLAITAALLLVGQLAYTVWLIVPAFPRAAATAFGVEMTFLVAAVALFLNRYLAAARSVAGISMP